MNLPIRPIEATDRHYVLKTWMRCVRSNTPYSLMSENAFSKYSARIHAIVGLCPTLICHDPEQRDLIYGFATFDPILRCLHMVNVRKDFRRNRIATSLITTAFGTLSHIRYTTYLDSITKYRLLNKWGLEDYDPYLLEGEI